MDQSGLAFEQLVLRVAVAVLLAVVVLVAELGQVLRPILLVGDPDHDSWRSSVLESAEVSGRHPVASSSSARARYVSIDNTRQRPEQTVAAISTRSPRSTAHNQRCRLILPGC